MRRSAISIIVLLICQTGLAQAPATQPTTGPTSDATLRRLFLQLSNPDPKLRDQAKIDLMGFTAADLPALRQIAADNAPLSPQVIWALHEIVVQVFLADEKYKDLNNADCNAATAVSPYFFLGVRWPQRSIQVDPTIRLGAEIDERLPGFPSFRFLRTGDMILGIYFDSDLPISLTPNCDMLIKTIQMHPLRQQIVLQVLRDGEIITVPVKMSPRPFEAGPPAGAPVNGPQPNNEASMDTFMGSRQKRADTYWRLNFDALVDPHSDATASNPLE
jgi:hypothetical protein